jgi:predicted transcriptional regulator
MLQLYKDTQDVIDMHVHEVMSDSVITSNESASILNICTLLSDSNVHSAVIIDNDGRPTGIVTEGDIVKLLASIPSSIYVPVKNVMTRTLITINSSDLVKNALVLMFLKNAKRLIVLDDEKKLVGIIAQTDILRMILTTFYMKESQKLDFRGQ